MLNLPQADRASTSLSPQLCFGKFSLIIFHRFYFYFTGYIYPAPFSFGIQCYSGLRKSNVSLTFIPLQAGHPSSLMFLVFIYYSIIPDLHCFQNESYYFSLIFREAFISINLGFFFSPQADFSVSYYSFSCVRKNFLGLYLYSFSSISINFPVTFTSVLYLQT